MIQLLFFSGFQECDRGNRLRYFNFKISDVWYRDKRMPKISLTNLISDVKLLRVAGIGFRNTIVFTV